MIMIMMMMMIMIMIMIMITIMIMKMIMMSMHGPSSRSKAIVSRTGDIKFLQQSFVDIIFQKHSFVSRSQIGQTYQMTKQ